jgi:hypothetical protein
LHSVLDLLNPFHVLLFGAPVASSTTVSPALLLLLLPFHKLPLLIFHRLLLLPLRPLAPSSCAC